MIPRKSNARLPHIETPRAESPGLSQVGLILKEARERRGLTVEGVAASTRVPRSHLEAIERGDSTSLPSGPFLKGFIASYARHLGQDVDLLIQILERPSEPVQPPPRVEEETPHEGENPPPRARSYTSPLLAGLGVVTLVGMITLVIWRLQVPPSQLQVDTSAGAGEARDPTPPTVGPRAKEDHIVRGPSVAGEDGRNYVVFEDLKRGGSPHSLKITAVHRSYVRVAESMAGTPLYEGVMEVGEIKELSSPTELWLVLGNAGGVSVNYGGAELIDLGQDGDQGAFAFLGP